MIPGRSTSISTPFPSSWSMSKSESGYGRSIPRHQYSSVRQPTSPLRVAVIPGDGIGKEVTPCGMRVLEKVGRQYAFDVHFTEFPYSCDYYLRHGTMMPADGLAQLRAYDAILLGAVGDPAKVPDHRSLSGLLLAIRQGFHLRVNIRPAQGYPGLGVGEALDTVVVRENSEGEYAGMGGRMSGAPMDANYHHYHNNNHHHHNNNHNNNHNISMGGPFSHPQEEIALQTAVHTRSAVEHTVSTAFTLARHRDYRSSSAVHNTTPTPQVTLATKSNAMPHAYRLWEEVFAQHASAVGLPTRTMHIDALAAGLIRNPSAFPVIAASNLFGDILSDMTAAMQGSLGIAGSANLSALPPPSPSLDTRDLGAHHSPGLFESVHGSAPDIAGRGIANPMATINAAALLLRYNGRSEPADAVETAVRTALSDPTARTPDLGGTASTETATRAVMSAL